MHGLKKLHKLEWKKQARNDLVKIVLHISKENPDAADKLADEIEAKAGILAEHPELSPAGRKRGSREMVVHPNYILIYRMTGNAVEVLRVKHTSQTWPV